MPSLWCEAYQPKVVADGHTLVWLLYIFHNQEYSFHNQFASAVDTVDEDLLQLASQE
jgi:hypothetical protein